MPRILSLLPSTTEIIFALGAEDQLVGLTHECDFPAQTSLLPRVTSARINASLESEKIDALVREQLKDSGSLYALDMELVATLRPEVVLTQQLCTVCAVGYSTVLAAMRDLPGPPEVVNIEPRTLGDVFASILRIGEIAGVAARAATVVEELRRRLSSVGRQAYAPRVLFLEWCVPPFSAGHWIPELIEAAGGAPFLSNGGEYSVQLSWDAISEAAPDVLAVSCCGFSVERAMIDVAASSDIRRLHAAHPELRVIIFDGNHFFSRPGPRLVESAELLASALRGIPPTSLRASVPDPYRFFTPLEEY